MNYKVDITKSITINGVVFEEGDALRIEHNLSTIKDEADPMFRERTSHEVPECFLNIPLMICSINPPTGHGAHYPLTVENISYREEMLRHFIFEEGNYTFTKIPEEDFEVAYEERMLGV